MKPIEAFEECIKRALNLAALYDACYNRRRRGIRQDWARNFKRLMHWPQKETIERADGRKIVVVIRKDAPISVRLLDEKKMDELLRASLVCAVSALDNYIHDIIVERVVRTIKKSEKSIHANLRNFSIPLIEVKKAVERARVREGPGGRIRPRAFNIVKFAFEKQLELKTFQSPDQIAEALNMIGVAHLWESVSRRLRKRPEYIKMNLNDVIHRRNQIVHEGDLQRIGVRITHSLREISYKWTIEAADFLVSVGRAIEDEILDQLG
jgi:hypothetical protein